MESGGQAGGETGGCPHRLRRSRTDFSPGVSGEGSAEARIRHSAPPSDAARRREAQGPFQAPQRRDLALWSPREGTGAGQPVERGRDAYAGRDIPCAPLSKGTLPHGLAALTVRQHALPGPAPAPRAEAGRASEPPFQRGRADAGSSPPHGQRDADQRPAPRFFARRCTRTCISRARAGRRYGSIRVETRVRPLRRSFPGALRRRRAAAKAWTAPPPFGCKHGPSDGKTAAGGCGRLRSGSRRVLPAGKKRSGKPDHSKARTGFARADTPGKPLRQGQNAPSLHPGNAPAGRGAALHRRLNAG